MIDIKKSKMAISNYIKQYNIEDEKIRLKVTHIERTANVARNIAEKLGLENEDIELAELIGLLHDIGRFEQIKRYNTFVDKNSVNHGELGAEILFKDGLIEKIIEDRKYDKIIKQAILNHNRSPKKIETNNERELLHTKIIRDADKIDILYLLTFEGKKAAWEKEDFSDDKITDEVYIGFKKDKNIDYSKMKTPADTVISQFAYVFDINFKYSLKLLYEKKYFEDIYKRITFNDKLTMERYNELYKITCEYLKENI